MAAVGQATAPGHRPPGLQLCAALPGFYFPRHLGRSGWVPRPPRPPARWVGSRLCLPGANGCSGGAGRRAAERALFTQRLCPQVSPRASKGTNTDQGTQTGEIIATGARRGTECWVTEPCAGLRSSSRAGAVLCHLFQVFNIFLEPGTWAAQSCQHPRGTRWQVTISAQSPVLPLQFRKPFYTLTTPEPSAAYSYPRLCLWHGTSRWRARHCCTRSSILILAEFPAPMHSAA